MSDEEKKGINENKENKESKDRMQNPDYVAKPALDKLKEKFAENLPKARETFSTMLSFATKKLGEVRATVKAKMDKSKADKEKSDQEKPDQEKKN